MKIHSKIIWSLFCLVIIPASLFCQNALIKEENRSIFTYQYSDPNPIAKIKNIYPYFRFDGYSIKGLPKEWKMVTLENSFIKVFITPQIGGKVWGAVDKTTGQPFIYYNNAVKFRDIAMRGPWTSGGIEFNFGDIGHAPTTASPVDYLLRENRDGSVSCIIGALDLASRTEWRVEIKLDKDKTYFETNSFWYNPTSLNTSLYNWTTAAADIDPSLQYYFPGNSYIDHDGSAKNWPVIEGNRDISLYKNNNYGDYHSYHVLGEYTGFFGGLFGNNKVGFGHWAPYTEKPGKKIWIWGLARQGEIWESLLTDVDKGNIQYTEIQTGLLFNQAAESSAYTPFKHLFFAPNSDERFNEIWFPVKSIKNIVDANKTGSLGVKLSDNNIEIGICANQQIDEELIVLVDGVKIHSEKISVKPSAVFTKSISIQKPGKIEVTLGNNLLSYKPSADKTLSRPVKLNKEFDWKSVEGLYTDAVEKARQRNYSDALNKFLLCLEKEPVFTPALVGAAEMYYRRREYKTALNFILKALSNDTYDPDANYIYGLISRKTNKIYDAKDAFGIAARSMKYKSTAYLQLAELEFIEKNYQNAYELANKSIEYNRYNIQSFKLLSVISRRLNNKDAAVSIISGILEVDPLNHFARFERYLVSRDKNDFTQFAELIKNEFPHETYLEIASYYFNLGLIDDAIETLNNAPVHPMVEYWKACCQYSQGKSSQAIVNLENASKMSPNLVFPFREEEVGLFEWAVKTNSNWKNKYYLSLLYFHFGRTADGERLLNECGNNPDYAPFYLSRISLREKKNYDSDIADFTTAVRLDPASWRTFHLYNNYLIDNYKYKEALNIISEASKKFKNDYIIQFDLAKSMLYNKQYDKCTGILDTLIMLPFEGARIGRDVQREALIMAALEKYKTGKYNEALSLANRSRKWPENLGVGMPYNPDLRIEDFIQAFCYKALNKKSEYNYKIKSIIDYTELKKERMNSNLLLCAIALKENNKTDKAGELLRNWESQTGSPAAKWSGCIYKKDYDSANNILLQAAGTNYNDIWNPLPADNEFKMIKEIIEVFYKN